MEPQQEKQNSLGVGIVSSPSIYSAKVVVKVQPTIPLMGHDISGSAHYTESYKGRR